MRQLLLLLLFCCNLTLQGQTQTLAAKKQAEFVFEGDQFAGFDSFGNLFYTKNNVVFKHTERGTLQYQNLALGNIKRIDLINPLRVLVFYEEFNTVVLLDSQMNEIQKIEFSKNDTPVIASAVGMSGQNQLWVYNSTSQQIGLLDLATNQFRNLGVPIKENLLFYQTDFNYFDWIDAQGQWFSCNVFGRVANNGAVAFRKHLQFVDRQRILYEMDGALLLEDRTSGKLYRIDIVEKTFANFYYKDQILSIFTAHGITNYKITLP